MDHDFGTLTTAINPRDDNSSQDEAVEQNTDKIHGHNIVSSSSDNRKTISVVIDEDEYDTDLSTSFASIKSPTEQYFYGSFTPYSDHNYIIGNQRPRSSNSNFPVIEGLNLEVIEDSSTNLPRAQTFRPLTKRYASYAYDQEDGNAFYSGSSAYYRNQIRENPEERLTHQKPQYGLPHSTRRQQVTSSEHLPLASHSLSRSRFVPTSESPYSPINQINRGSLPPQRSHGGMHIDSSYLIDGSPAPIVTATRGRPPIGRNKFARIAQDEHLYNQNIILTKDSGDQTRYILPMHTGFPSEQQKKQLPESRQQQRFRQLQKRNISVHPSSRNDIHQHYDEQKTEDQQRHDYLEEEEMLNEDFFAQQHQKYSQQQQSSDLERNIQTRVRNDTITPSDPIQSLNTSPNLLDTSKPPDDPYLPPQQAPQYSGMEIQNRQFSNQQQLHYPPGFDTSAIDGTINSVVRGEASVMQQHFGPPISCATSDDLSYSSTFQRQNIEPQQQDLNYDQQSLQIPESIDMFYPQEHLAKQRPMSSHSVFSHGLDELAKASSTLLDHSTATSSDRMADHQQLPELVSRTKSHNQAQFNQAPGQQSQTLHFKVVQTSHRDEPSSLSQNQDYVQQVFTVQQQQRQKTVDSAPFDLPRPDQYRTFSASRALPQVRQNVGSGRRQRSTALSPVSIASNGGIEAEEPEFQQMGDFTKPMKWQRSFRKQLPEEVEAKDASSIPVRASNANESLVIEPKKRGRISKRNKNELEQQEGFDYITRCICGMKHNDPFMIQCDRCDVWQHGICMSVRENSVPDTYLCELCQPRSLGLTPKQAKSIQVRSLIAAKAPKPKKNKSLPTIKYRSKTPALSAALKITSKIRRTKLGADSILKKGGISKRKDVMRSSFANVNVKAATKRQKHLKKETSFPVQNQYSRGIRSLMSNMQPYVLGELGLLRRLDHTPLARPMLVAPNIEGLVATPGKNSNIPMGMPIVEYTGAISLLSEVKNKAMNREHGHKFTLVYSGFTDHEKVFIDASKLGSIARSVRRSCRPNATLQHAIVDGQLRIYLYAAMNIDRSSEVTIPFDYDYRESSEPVECACNTLLGMGDMEHCPIFTYNKSLQSNLNNKMHRDKSIASSPRRFVSPRKTRNSTSSPITVKAEAVPASKLDVQKSSDEHKKLSDDPLPAIQPKRRSPRTTCLIEAKIPKLELANSPTSNDPNIDDEKSLSRNSLSSSLIASTKSFSQTSQTRSLRSNASQFMGQIKWGDKPPPNKRNDPSSVSSSSYLQSNKTSRRLSDNPTSPRLVTLKKSKDEIVVNGDGNFTREERKLQATIASIERAEHLSHEKKRKQNEKIHPPSEPPIAIKLKRKSYNIKTSTKAVQDDSICINFRRLFDELARILQMKFKNWQEFKLPPSFDDLRTELVEKSQVAEKPDNINNAKKAEGSSNVKIRGVPTTSKAPISDNEETINNQKMISPTINECVCQKQQLDGGSLNLSLSIPEIDKDIKTVSAPPSTVNSPTDTSDVEKPDRESVIDGNSETIIRPPNTKAHKKLTLEEYKRKKKAEMEAKQKQISGDDVSTEKTTSFQEHLSSSLYPHSSSAFSSTSLTRHSPRKSFIPAINSLPSSPPQQLEDLPSISSIGGRHKQKLFNTPSLDELKKRIHGESFSRSCGSSSGERLEPRSHPSSPSDMPPPPPPPKNRPLPERLSMTLDDRLKKLVKRTT